MKLPNPGVHDGNTLSLAVATILASKLGVLTLYLRMAVNERKITLTVNRLCGINSRHHGSLWRDLRAPNAGSPGGEWRRRAD